jgi:hypothetical protein
MEECRGVLGQNDPLKLKEAVEKLEQAAYKISEALYSKSGSSKS